MRPIALAVLLYVASMVGVVVPSLAIAEASPPSPSEFFTGAPYTGPLARPDLSTPEAKSFRTRLTKAAHEKPNFASHYQAVVWGCGASCAAGAVVDAETGRVVFFPFSIGGYEGPTDGFNWEPIEFRADSSLIVFHGKRNDQDQDGDHYYNFDGRTFKHLFTKLTKAKADAENAAAPQEASICAKIRDDGARLKCFDAVVGPAK